MLYQHTDYNEYRKAQVRKNKRKITNQWVGRGEVKEIAKHIRENVGSLSFGICHGVRKSDEVKWFRRYLKIDVIGTDISPTAKSFKNTIQLDFHKALPEWIGSVDFIYSNSLDHSYDPEGCLATWVSCLRPDGLCYIHWGKDHQKHFDKADCFKADIDYYRDTLLKPYNIVDEIEYRNRTIFAVGNGK
jgi:SAM-dependent methyltransferase